MMITAAWVGIAFLAGWIGGAVVQRAMIKPKKKPVDSEFICEICGDIPAHIDPTHGKVVWGICQCELDRDWPEDSGMENGNYQNRCVMCKELFIGHKRRAICKVCIR